MKSSYHKWQSFLRLLVDPWTLVLLALTCTALFLVFSNVQSVGTGTSKITLVVFSFFLALSSATLGSRIAAQNTQATADDRLVERGKSSIRNLKLLFTNLCNLESRLRHHLSKSGVMQVGSHSYPDDLVELSMMMIKEEVIKSIEDWTDVIPEANLKSHFENLSSLNESITHLEREVSSLEKQLASRKGLSRKAVESKELKVEAAKNRISRLTEQLRHARQKLDHSVLSGLTNAIITDRIELLDPLEQANSVTMVSSFNDGADKRKLTNSVAIENSGGKRSDKPLSRNHKN